MIKYFLLTIILSLSIIHAFSQTFDKERLIDSIYINALNAKEARLISVRGNKYKVWTKRSGTGKIKLLLLHGGPGTSPEYFENFPSALGKNYTIYFYSQLGTYFSDMPTDSSLYSVDGFINDIEDVRIGLGLDNFYILGHSWGNQLAQAYASKYQRHLKGIILCNNINEKDEVIEEYQTQLYANILDSIPEYSRYADSLRFGFSGHFTDFSSKESLGSQIRKKAWPLMLKKHYARLPDPLPENLTRSKLHSTGVLMSKLGFMAKINETDFNKYLADISIPTLLLGAKYDFIPPGYYVKMLDKMKNNANVEVYICPNGSHFAMWDDKENFFNVINKFMLKTEKIVMK